MCKCLILPSDRQESSRRSQRYIPVNVGGNEIEDWYFDKRCFHYYGRLHCHNLLHYSHSSENTDEQNGEVAYNPNAT